MSGPVRRTRGFILLTVVLALTLVAAVAFLLNRGGGMNMSMAARGLQADSARYVAEAGLAQINSQTQNRSCTGYTDLPATTDLPPTKFGADIFTATVTPKAGSPVNFSAIGTTAGGAAATLTRSNVTVTAALSPVSAGDTTLDSNLANVDINYGANQSLTLSYPNNRALLKFNFSGIPSGARITSATLQLNKQDSSGSSVSVSLYRVTTPWTEGTGATATGATYKTSNGSCLWSAAGGDYDPAAISSIVADNSIGRKSWDATSLVQGWVDGSYANYGMILIPTSGGGGDFTSRDNSANATLQPKLLVSYKCGPTGLPTALLGQAPAILLGTAENFVILTKTGITNVPTSVITGNIATSPITGASMTGFTSPSTQVSGFIFSVDAAGPAGTVTNPCSLTTAVGDMETAYTDAAGRAPGVGSFLNVGGGTLANQTLVPGTYTWPPTSNVTITTDLTLSGGPNDVWIFQIPGTLNMAAAKNVILLGGARARNIYWQVADVVTLGTTSHFEGTILGQTIIALQTGASINGRLLAQTAVTLQQNTVTQPLP